jgi:UDP-glucose 4-epimerase
MMAILVTGGAGYIGSVTVELLCQRGEDVVVLDNLFRGHRAAVDPRAGFYQGNIGDRALVRKIVHEHKIDACIHFAALAYVAESVSNPALYFDNNIGQGVALLEALRDSGVNHFVFSSTCATYGEPKSIPIPEDHPQWPTNPYGWSKLILERALESYDRAYGFRSVSLRYFNACGATDRYGEDHQPETHLIPLVLAAARGIRPFISVFGNDYPTPDGTAIRDYIHIADLGTAHIQALEHLRAGGNSEFINLGNGQGYSVLEVINTARQVTGNPIEERFEPRRPGDPSRLIADAAKAHQVLGWKPAFPRLEAIISSAWEWHEAHPNGYEY